MENTANTTGDDGGATTDPSHHPSHLKRNRPSTQKNHNNQNNDTTKNSRRDPRMSLSYVLGSGRESFSNQNDPANTINNNNSNINNIFTAATADSSSLPVQLRSPIQKLNKLGSAFDHLDVNPSDTEQMIVNPAAGIPTTSTSQISSAVSENSDHQHVKILRPRKRSAAEEVKHKVDMSFLSDANDARSSCAITSAFLDLLSERINATKDQDLVLRLSGSDNSTQFITVNFYKKKVELFHKIEKDLIKRNAYLKSVGKMQKYNSDELRKEWKASRYEACISLYVLLRDELDSIEKWRRWEKVICDMYGIEGKDVGVENFGEDDIGDGGIDGGIDGSEETWHGVVKDICKEYMLKGADLGIEIFGKDDNGQLVLKVPFTRNDPARVGNSGISTAASLIGNRSLSICEEPEAQGTVDRQMVKDAILKFGQQHGFSSKDIGDMMIEECFKKLASEVGTSYTDGRGNAVTELDKLEDDVDEDVRQIGEHEFETELKEKYEKEDILEGAVASYSRGVKRPREEEEGGNEEECAKMMKVEKAVTLQGCSRDGYGIGAGGETFSGRVEVDEDDEKAGEVVNVEENDDEVVADGVVEECEENGEGMIVGDEVDNGEFVGGITGDEYVVDMDAEEEMGDWETKLERVRRTI
ncbi:hypothetical protein HDU76_007442 [Blyttiomyces sp. JEL0837]|nr:hypothetical protein HDU76_007442 [Blyttiomyces sp. JEL0837]